MSFADKKNKKINSKFSGRDQGRSRVSKNRAFLHPFVSPFLLESDVDSVELFRRTLRFFWRRFDGVVIFFRFRLQRRVGIFSFLYMLFFFFQVHVSFSSSQISIGTRAIGWLDHQPLCCCFLVKSFCISPVLRWFRSFLVGWSQHARHGSTTSTAVHLICNGTVPGYLQSCFARLADITWRQRLQSSASHRLGVPPVRLSTVGCQP